ncbi:MAG: hypothetical protein ACI4M5_02995 [Christensenellales bacterium]
MYNDEQMPGDKAIHDMNEEYDKQTKSGNFPIFLVQYLVKIKRNLVTLTAMVESLQAGAKTPINVFLLDNIAKLLSKNSIRIDKNNFFSVTSQYRTGTKDNLRKVLVDMRRLNLETVALLTQLDEKASGDNTRDMLINQLAIGYYLGNIV